LSFNSNGLGTYTWDGEISDVQVYDAALSASEIWDIYANSKPRATNQVSRWKLNGNALDEWGSNDGTVSGALPLPARANTPVVGDSLNQRSIASFDGVNDYVSIGVTSAHYTGTGLSYSIWFKAPPDLSDYLSLYSDYDGSASYTGTLIRISNTGVLFFYMQSKTQGNVFAMDAGTGHDDNNWHHLAFTWDGSTGVAAQLYIDNVLIVSANASYALAGFAAPDYGTYSIGRQNSGTSYTFEGELANLAIYNDARTASEILTDYENGYIDESDANLVSYWPRW